jgi:Mg/Co/Ni transporter MgtE
MVIVQFLTMLVGAGGNAGNQAAVRVIRSLAVGTLNRRTMKWFLRNEAKMALSLSLLIGMTGFARAAIFRVPPGETIAVTASVCAIVAISVAIGNALPLGMKRVGIDPAHSSTTIQVVMDILGVLITVCVSSFVLSFKVFRDEDIDSIMKSSTSSTLPMSTVT